MAQFIRMLSQLFYDVIDLTQMRHFFLKLFDPLLLCAQRAASHGNVLHSCMAILFPALPDQKTDQSRRGRAGDTGGPFLILGRTRGEHIEATRKDDASHCEREQKKNERHSPF